MISNIVQRVAGYSEFTREICPIISPATIHPLAVDAVTVYELMASTTHEENFTILDQNNQPVSSPKWARVYKNATLTAFLDVEKMKPICDDSGLIFQRHLVYRPDDTFALVGELKPCVTPAISYYDQRRKMKISRKQRKTTTTTLTTA